MATGCPTRRLSAFSFLIRVSVTISPAALVALAMKEGAGGTGVAVSVSTTVAVGSTMGTRVEIGTVGRNDSIPLKLAGRRFGKKYATPKEPTKRIKIKIS